MKVLHIEDRFHPDYGYQINNFARLHNSKNELYIITSKSLLPWHIKNKEQIFSDRDMEFEKKHKVKIIRLECTFEIDSRVWLKGLISEIKKIDPDIIYSHGVETFTSIRIILSKLSNHYKIVSDTHVLPNLSKIKSLGYMFNAFMKYCVAKIINKKKIIVFYTTESNRIILEKLYEIHPLLIKRSLIGTDINIFKYDEDARTKLRKYYSLSEKDFVILYAGKIDADKRPHLILDALKKIENPMKKIYLFMIGEKEESYFARYIDIKESNYYKIETVNKVLNIELYKYYSMGDLAIFPTNSTLSSLDAQACKLPVIMEDNAANSERVKEGGLMYSKGDIKELSDKIKSLILDEERRSIMSDSAINYVINNYDYVKIVKETESIIERHYLDG